MYQSALHQKPIEQNPPINSKSFLDNSLNEKQQDIQQKDNTLILKQQLFELENQLKQQIDENILLKQNIRENDKKIFNSEGENRKLKQDKRILQDKIFNYENRIRDLLEEVEYYRNQNQQQEEDEGDEEEKNDEDEDEEESRYNLQESDIREMINNMRLQAIQNDPFMLMPEQDPNALDTDNMTYEQLLELQEKIGFVNRGVPKEQIKKIPKFIFKKEDEEREGDKCAICCNEYIEGDKIKKLECNHIYHSKCVKQWLINEKKCPVCKKEVEIK